MDRRLVRRQRIRLARRAANPFVAFNANAAQIVSNWTLETPDSISDASITLDSGDAYLEAPTGSVGPSSSFWFDANRGILLHRGLEIVGGGWEARMHATIRNGADTGDPNLTSAFRFAGLAVHDPANFAASPPSYYNYLHLAAGGSASFDGASGNRKVESKTNDDSAGGGSDASAYAAAIPGSTSGAFELIFALRRRASNDQIFDMSYEWQPAGGLWDTPFASLTPGPFATVDRTDNTVPDRNANLATNDEAVPLPDGVYVGAVVYSNDTSTDVSIRIHEFGVRGTDA